MNGRSQVVMPGMLVCSDHIPHEDMGCDVDLTCMSIMLQYNIMLGCVFMMD